MNAEAIFKFLTQLELNNNREWFSDNKQEFRAVETEIKIVYNTILEALNTHDNVDKVKIFRIYRDVRFSKNKLPYKTHFGGSFHRVKPELRGGYYLQIQPGNKSFMAAGFWNPEPADLLRIRKEFETDASEIRAIIENPNLKNTWGELTGDEVKTAPKGFNRNDENIDLIRKKQFIFTKNFTDKDVLDPEFTTRVNAAFKTIRPYFDYMSSVLTTDLNGVSTIS
ncbi:DUF2461 domain-containing protein [Bizionia paragorgiae]|uniref:TIGR02453 family protein n=1 Tax=Bizionia paragorgiae TaxID=283786 RepID=A0A1H4AAV3_BIZPA|nr:DUF2461 domain-containing protein [Bizionia paragorgiae]MDX1270769.1 DUF2461 domain-containing protein [Bizionia paragorgiae]SEA33057.1 TIGR02453 family protein [Bizionia paragorgiae]